jgi:hypothetical protein
MSLRLGLLALILVVSGSVRVNADAPPTLPAKFCSRNQRFCATPNLAKGTTGIAARRGGPNVASWSIPTVVRTGVLADDGSVLIQLPDGADLLEPPPDRHEVVLTFWFPHAEPVRVHLFQLIENIPGLPKTVSHVSWAEKYGFDRTGSFFVTTTEGITFHFESKTGKPTNRPLFDRR